ncbi:MAG: type IV secretory system conjugative DNA transfer family protein [Cohaesibacter sp.]|nr:type IV secretory system conjugative DNA transfer family protein [Cohaesibacter sp.]
MFFRDFVLNGDGEGRVGSSVSVCPDKIIKRREGFSSSYFIIPPEKIATYAPVLRVIFGMFIREMQSMKRGTLRVPEAEACAPEYFERKALFVLDEVAQLGYMKVIEDAMSIAASADMRFWLIFQDLNQLYNLYPKAQSMISNCKMECYFAPGDLETATKISDRLGDVESVLGQKQKLVTPQELLDDTFKDEQIIFAKGVPPIRAKLRYAYEDEYILGEIENAEKYWKMEPDRLYMAGRLIGDSIVEEDGSISPWPPKKEMKNDTETAQRSDETVTSKSEEIASKSPDDEDAIKDTVPPPPDF